MAPSEKSRNLGLIQQTIEIQKSRNPEYLWIGCSDSRVPAEVIVNSTCTWTNLSYGCIGALNVLAGEHPHIAKVTPSEMASEGLPWVHVVISNLKNYLQGTFHGISSHYGQEYPDEFCDRLNRRFW